VDVAWFVDQTDVPAGSTTVTTGWDATDAGAGSENADAIAAIDAVLSEFVVESLATDLAGSDAVADEAAAYAQAVDELFATYALDTLG
jgi:hypothetical protein